MPGGPCGCWCADRLQDRASLWATLALVFLVAAAFCGFFLSVGLPSPIRRSAFACSSPTDMSGCWMDHPDYYRPGIQAFSDVCLGGTFSGSSGGRNRCRPCEIFTAEPYRQCPAARCRSASAGAAAGIVVNHLRLITIGLGLVIAGVCAFLVNFFLMARWALLGTVYRPSREDWEKFYVNYPGRR